MIYLIVIDEALPVTVNAMLLLAQGLGDAREITVAAAAGPQ